MAMAACLLGAIVPLLLLGWSELAALGCGLILFTVSLTGPLLLDRRMTDAARTERLARAWVRNGPDPEQVALLARGPARIAEPGPAWQALARSGLLRPRSWYSTFGLASSPLNELANVYVAALRGSGFGLVGALSVVVIDVARIRSAALAAVAVVVAMLAFTGVELIARHAGTRAGERLTWLDVDDPRTPAGHRALRLLSTTSPDVQSFSTATSWDEYRESVIAGRPAVRRA